MTENKMLKVFKLIVAILPKGKVKRLMPIIKNAGIFGATKFSGKGMCTPEGRRLLKLRVDSSRDILLILTLEANKDKLIKLLEEHGNLKDPGEGIVFVVDISEVVG